MRKRIEHIENRCIETAVLQPNIFSRIKKKAPVLRSQMLGEMRKCRVVSFEYSYIYYSRYSEICKCKISDIMENDIYYTPHTQLSVRL